MPVCIGYKSFPIELDSGADISVVPEGSVPLALRTGKTVSITSFNGHQTSLPTALVTICIGSPHHWSGEAALLPAERERTLSCLFF